MIEEEPSPGLMARLGVPVGGRVRKSRAVGDQSSPPSSEMIEERWSLDATSEGRSGCSHASRSRGVREPLQNLLRNVDRIRPRT